MNLLKKIFCLLLLCQFLVLENAAMALWFCVCSMPQEAKVEMSRECCKNSAESLSKSAKFLDATAPVYDQQYSGAAYTAAVELCTPGCDPFRFQRFIYLAAEGKLQFKLFSVKNIDSQKQAADTVYYHKNIRKSLKDRQISVKYPPLYLSNQTFLI